MPGIVIQGHFPHGLTRIAQAKRSVSGRVTAVELPPTFRYDHGPGQPMPPVLQRKMEAAFGARFHDVRLHIDPQATFMGASAFTRGSHIHLAPQHAQASSRESIRVIAHELAHVVQQRTGRVKNPWNAGTAVVHDPHLEADADRIAQNVVQRLVIKISDDDLTRGTYNNLTIVEEGYTDMTGSLRPPSSGGRLLDSLAPHETLHVIIHGGGGTVEGMDPGQFLQYLEGLGLDRRVHQGTIRLVSCYSGTPDMYGMTFASRFAVVLRQHRYSNAVIGFNGLVRAAKHGQILVISPGNAAQFWRLRQLKFNLEEEMRDFIEPMMPGPTDSHEYFLSWKKDVEEWQKKYKKVVEKMESLWERQSLPRNIVYIGEAPNKDDFYDRQREYLLKMNMITSTESVRPLRDYSSSYIS